MNKYYLINITKHLLCSRHSARGTVLNERAFWLMYNVQACLEISGQRRGATHLAVSSGTIRKAGCRECSVGLPHRTKGRLTPTSCALFSALPSYANVVNPAIWTTVSTAPLWIRAVVQQDRSVERQSGRKGWILCLVKFPGKYRSTWAPKSVFTFIRNMCTFSWLVILLTSKWTPGVVDGPGGLACCDPRGRKESDTTERLNH